MLTLTKKTYYVFECLHTNCLYISTFFYLQMVIIIIHCINSRIHEPIQSILTNTIVYRICNSVSVNGFYNYFLGLAIYMHWYFCLQLKVYSLNVSLMHDLVILICSLFCFKYILSLYFSWFYLSLVDCSVINFKILHIYLFDRMFQSNDMW